MRITFPGVLLGSLVILSSGFSAEPAAAPPSALPPMLNLKGTGANPDQINFATLPVLKGEHAVVTRGEAPWLFRLHSYLVHFDGRYWCLWSHGPKVEDHPTQRDDDDGFDIGDEISVEDEHRHDHVLGGRKCRAEKPRAESREFLGPELDAKLRRR